jgi:uncharacterized protein
MIIADTGFFVALGNRGDKFHEKAKELITVLKDPLITTYPVITETSYLLLNKAGNVAQYQFLQKVVQGGVRIFQLDLHHLQRMLDLMVKFSDLPMDLADASLVVVAEHLKQGRILTADHRDFQIYRWNESQGFENLLV